MRQKNYGNVILTIKIKLYREHFIFCAICIYYPHIDKLLKSGGFLIESNDVYSEDGRKLLQTDMRVRAEAEWHCNINIILVYIIHPCVCTHMLQDSTYLRMISLLRTPYCVFTHILRNKYFSDCLLLTTSKLPISKSRNKIQ